MLCVLFYTCRSAGTAIWLDNLSALPGFTRLVRSLSGEDLTLRLADQSVGRYLDLYVTVNK